MSNKRVWHRPDSTPTEEEREFEAVEYADPANREFPVNTHEEILAAWEAANSQECAACYDVDELEGIKDRILIAAEEYGILLPSYG